MSRRRMRQCSANDGAQDPGKDLFAYLFLLIMIFTFMVLLTTEERRNGMAGQTAPASQPTSSRATLTAVQRDQIGTLALEQGQLMLRFGRTLYHPRHDIQELIAAGCVAHLPSEDGGEKRVLYIDEQAQQAVSLNDYLQAFKALADEGITVAFTEQVQK